MCDADNELQEWDKLCNARQVEWLLSHLRKARYLYDIQDEDYSLGATMHFVVDCVKVFIEEPTPLHYLSLIQTENMMLGALIAKGANFAPVGWGRLWEARNHLPSLRDALEVAVAENDYLFDFRFFSDSDFDPTCI
ncbi:hypothetical protein B0181_11825 [Moraxella caviae]|uniref:Uncharacterized protein n=1 Tax=Moraxella caviae TaxID=34060 RepID=A0A1S9ZS83_9GAMM|nr:hypothetical protein [Moraxella caviae]OOR85911.1 hypothetical protein B0181_11825 [Moraxella caviae]STZ13530.1 Uncharacterised protein [Moraxella caviae]